MKHDATRVPPMVADQDAERSRRWSDVRSSMVRLEMSLRATGNLIAEARAFDSMEETGALLTMFAERLEAIEIEATALFAAPGAQPARP